MANNSVKLIEIIAKSLVDNPDEVVVKAEKSGKSTVVSLSVANSDMGKVIGKQGRIAKAIRTVLKASSIQSNDNVILNIEDK